MCAQVLQIQDEQLSGTLPPGWAQELPHLQQLTLGSLQVQGSLPPEWGAWGSLRRLLVFNCQVRPPASRVKAEGDAGRGFAPTLDDGARGADVGWMPSVAASSACASFCVKAGALPAAMPSLVLRTCSCTACEPSKAPSPGLAQTHDIRQRLDAWLHALC